MQAVVLAAGRGTRMGHRTKENPKPMLRVAGKTLLEHKLDVLPESVQDIVIVVGYQKEKIVEYFGSRYQGRRITYALQENTVGGTMDALRAARPHLSDRFLVLSGDDIYHPDDLARPLEHEWAVLVHRTDAVGPAAKVVVENGHVTDIVEKEEHDGGAGYANAGLYVLDLRIFDYTPVAKSALSREHGLPQTIISAARHIPVRAVESRQWIQITTPEDLKAAEVLLQRT